MRIGLLGASRIAPNAIIGPASRRADVTVTAVAGSDPARAAEFALRHGIAATAGSYTDLVGRDDVDVVYCALPAPAHLSVCEQALHAGKTLLIEKPFAADAAAARRIVAAAKAAGRPAIEAFHYRFHTQFLRALALMRSGELGRIRSVRGLFNALIPKTPGELRWSRDLGGGAMMDLGCYVIHAQRTLLGAEPNLERVEAEIDEGVDASLRAELTFGGVRAIAACSMTQALEAQLEIEGEDASLTLHNFVAPQHGGRLLLRTRKNSKEELAHGPTSYEAQLDHLVQVWRSEASPLTGGVDAIANMTVIDACRKAAHPKEQAHD